MSKSYRSLTTIICGLTLVIATLSGCSSSDQNTDEPQAEIINETESSNSPSELPSDSSPTVVLQLAQKTLATIEDDFDWVTSAAELAIAEDEIAQNENAWVLMQQATHRTESIEDSKKRANALSELAAALSSLKPNQQFAGIHSQIKALASSIDNPDKQIDITGKLYSSLSAHGQSDSAYSKALGIAVENPAQESYKLRTLREIIVHMANQGHFDSAIKALDSLKGDFTYYQAVARTEIVTAAIKKNKYELIAPLMDEAIEIGRAQENGYFTAGALRDVAHGYISLGDIEKANAMIEEARNAARSSIKPNERARSMSRIATKLSNIGELNYSKDIITESITLTDSIESEVMLHYSLYEIVGAAAFSSEFVAARSLIKDIPDTPFGSATSLRSAAERDLAWGLARYGKTTEAIETALSITSLRESTQTLSRIARLLNNPEMSALPRYL